MQGGVLMGLEKPTSIVAMLRIFVLPNTAKGGCAPGFSSCGHKRKNHKRKNLDSKGVHDRIPG